MIFVETMLSGVFIIRMEPKVDERGFFARTWCRQEYAKEGLNAELAQCSLSGNPQKGTLRGMHYQEAPHAEAKSVRCIRGAVFDVVLDLRPQSLTFRNWLGLELTAANRDMIYIPEGCAHGFLTLEDNTEVLYQISEFYHPELARGVRWDDPAFQIAWPALPEVISERDQTYPDFQ
jgi:dTDP-4-dehydrorhamnose 3,5-epimerase